MKWIETILKKTLPLLDSYIITSNFLLWLTPYLHDITIGKQCELWYLGPLNRHQKAWVRTGIRYNIETEFLVAMKVVRSIKNSSELLCKCNFGAYHWSSCVSISWRTDVRDIQEEDGTFYFLKSKQSKGVIFYCECDIKYRSPGSVQFSLKLLFDMVNI